MAEAKNQVTPEQAAAERDRGFADAAARRAQHAAMRSSGVKVLSRTISDQEIGGRNMHILDSLLPDEPIVIFRAKDILSTMVLQRYLTMLEDYVPGSEIAEAVVNKITEFRNWQQANPQSVRIPD